MKNFRAKTPIMIRMVRIPIRVMISGKKYIKRNIAVTEITRDVNFEIKFLSIMLVFLGDF